MEMEPALRPARTPVMFAELQVEAGDSEFSVWPGTMAKRWRRKRRLDRGGPQRACKVLSCPIPATSQIPHPTDTLGHFACTCPRSSFPSLCPSPARFPLGAFSL